MHKTITLITLLMMALFSVAAETTDEPLPPSATWTTAFVRDHPQEAFSHDPIKAVSLYPVLLDDENRADAFFRQYPQQVKTYPNPAMRLFVIPRNVKYNLRPYEELIKLYPDYAGRYPDSYQEAVSRDISILNENKGGFILYAKGKGIEFIAVDAEFERASGSQFTTRGKDTTTFSMYGLNNLAQRGEGGLYTNFKITREGSLVFEGPHGGAFATTGSAEMDENGNFIHGGILVHRLDEDMIERKLKDDDRTLAAYKKDNLQRMGVSADDIQERTSPYNAIRVDYGAILIITRTGEVAVEIRSEGGRAELFRGITLLSGGVTIYDDANYRFHPPISGGESRFSTPDEEYTSSKPTYVSYNVPSLEDLEDPQWRSGKERLLNPFFDRSQSPPDAYYDPGDSYIYKTAMDNGPYTLIYTGDSNDMSFTLKSPPLGTSMIIEEGQGSSLHIKTWKQSPQQPVNVLLDEQVQLSTTFSELSTLFDPERHNELLVQNPSGSTTVLVPNIRIQRCAGNIKSFVGKDPPCTEAVGTIDIR